MSSTRGGDEKLPKIGIDRGANDKTWFLMQMFMAKKGVIDRVGCQARHREGGGGCQKEKGRYLIEGAQMTRFWF